MTTEAKKQEERALLELIFPAEQYQATCSEAPDFRVRVGAEEFGAEVTQLYESGSNARLANVPSYVPNLLAGAAPIHKDDAHLARQELVVQRGHDGSRETILAVVSSVPSVAVYEGLLAELVRTKSNKQYAADLQFLDLIVEDKTKTMALIEHERVVEVLIREDLIRALAASRFREVFLLTRSKEHGRIVVPLKASLLMREVLVFMHACKAIQAAKRTLPSAAAHEVIAEHCNRRGFSVGLFEDEDRFFLAFGSMSVVLSEPHRFEFEVQHDHVLATTEVVVSEEVRTQYDPIFQEVDAWATTRTVPVGPGILATGGP
jgi:hypothetical protein